MLNKRQEIFQNVIEGKLRVQEIFQNVIEGKLRVQDRARERLHDQNVEEIEELVHRKIEEVLQTAGNEHDLLMYQNEKEEA